MSWEGVKVRKGLFPMTTLTFASQPPFPVQLGKLEKKKKTALVDKKPLGFYTVAVEIIWNMSS